MSQWRYFLVGEDAQTEMIYRWPANGKSLKDQEREDIQVFGLNGEWLRTERAGIFSVMLNGWFSEGSDEISEQAAQQFIREGLGRYGRAQKPG